MLITRGTSHPISTTVALHLYALSTARGGRPCASFYSGNPAAVLLLSPRRDARDFCDAHLGYSSRSLSRQENSPLRPDPRRECITSDECTAFFPIVTRDVSEREMSHTALTQRVVRARFDPFFYFPDKRPVSPCDRAINRESIVGGSRA